jgi:hypothetical protein
MLKPNDGGDADAPIEITVFTKSGGPLSKRISLNGDGTVKSDGSACVMMRGWARRTHLAGVHDLAELIDRLETSEAIALGRLRPDLANEGQTQHGQRPRHHRPHGQRHRLSRTAAHIRAARLRHQRHAARSR